MCDDDRPVRLPLAHTPDDVENLVLLMIEGAHDDEQKVGAPFGEGQVVVGNIARPPSPRVSRKRMTGAPGKSKISAVRVQALNPKPISAAAPVIARTIELLPDCTLPISQINGASALATSATSFDAASTSAGRIKRSNSRASLSDSALRRELSLMMTVSAMVACAASNLGIGSRWIWGGPWRTANRSHCPGFCPRDRFQSRGAAPSGRLWSREIVIALNPLHAKEREN
ncbi:MAG: hypothetical protein R3D67_03405 [Hyphomicrobiaceae bacterium]